MGRLVLRGLAARKLRGLLTALAIVLGVGLIAGTYVLTDTIDSSFDDIFRTANEGSDVVVKSPQTIDSPDGTVPPIERSVVDEVASVDGVASAAGSVFDLVTIFDKQGERIGQGGTPNFVASIAPAPFDPFSYPEGSPPDSGGELAVDELTAERHGFEVGDTIEVAGVPGARQYTVSGIATFGEVSSIGGAATVIATLAEAQRLTGKEGEVDQVSAAAADGLGPEQLASSIDSALGDDLAVRTGSDDAASQAADLEENLGFLQTGLLVFAGIALFVGAFTIFNTFSITVAQRMREFAMLRTLGASRRQVVRVVMVEALLIGVVASVLGLFAGLGLAKGLGSLFTAFGIDLPNSGTVILARTVIVSLAVGVLVTVLAALVPALRATRVPPVAALREGAVIPPGRGGRLALPIAIAMLVLGGALICVGLFAGIEADATALTLVGAGAVAVFLGAALVSPRLVGPIAAAVGRPLERLRGLRGRLARENAIRNPGRTAITAAALMVGLALVTFVTTFAAGARASVDDAVGEQFAGDVVVQNTDGFSPIPGTVADAVRDIDGVEVVSPLAGATGELPGEPGTVSATGVEPDTLASVVSLDFVEGSPEALASLAPGEAVLDRAFAEDQGLEVGDELTVETPTGDERVYNVRGAVEDASFMGDFLIPASEVGRDYDEQSDYLVLLGVVEGADAGAVKQDVGELLEERFPMAEALNQEELRESFSDHVNQALALIYVLLALAIVVSLFGIVNTLALSIQERTREIGTLRAIGMSARQLRSVVRYEAVITALIGAVLGTVIGVCFGWVVIQPLEEDGFAFSFPAGTVAAMLVVAAIAGVLGAIMPARRATRVDLLDALAYE